MFFFCMLTNALVCAELGPGALKKARFDDWEYSSLATIVANPLISSGANLTQDEASSDDTFDILGSGAVTDLLCAPDMDDFLCSLMCSVCFQPNFDGGHHLCDILLGDDFEGLGAFPAQDQDAPLVCYKNSLNQDSPQQSLPFFTFPRYHDTYSYRICYINQNFSMVFLYVQRLCNHARICDIKYGIVHQSYLLHDVCEDDQLAESWRVTYSREFSWVLGLSVSKKGLKFVCRRGDDVCERFIYVDRDRRLVCTKGSVVDKYIASQVSHLYYDKDSRNFLFARYDNVDSPIQVSWDLCKDEVIIKCPHDGAEPIITFSAQPSQPTPKAAVLKVKEFLHMVLPRLQGYKDIKIEMSRASTLQVHYEHNSGACQWEVVYNAQQKGTTVTHHYAAAKSYSLQFSHDPSAARPMELRMDNRTLRAHFSKEDKEHSRLSITNLMDGMLQYVNCVTHQTILGPTEFICAFYTKDSVDVAAVSNNGYMRIYSPSVEPLNLAFDAITHFYYFPTLDHVQRLMLYPVPETLKGGNHCVTIKRSKIHPTNVVSIACEHPRCFVERLYPQSYSDTIYWDEASVLQWQRATTNSSKKPFQLFKATLRKEVAMDGAYDQLRFFFSVKQQVLKKTREVENTFKIHCTENAILLSDEVDQSTCKLCDHTSSVKVLTAFVEKQYFCLGICQFIILINDEPGFAVGFFHKYTEEDCPAIQSGSLGWGCWKYSGDICYSNKHARAYKTLDLSKMAN